MLSGFFTGGPTGDQPIVVGMFTSILGWMTTGLAEAFSFEITPNTVLDLTVFLTALVWVVTITAVASLSGKQPSDPVVLAFAPTVLLVGFTSWDLWAVMFMMLAVASYIRGSPGVAGVWIGLGATVSFLPLLVLIAILFLAARYRYLGDFISALVVSLIVFAMVNGPFMVRSSTAGASAWARPCARRSRATPAGACGTPWAHRPPDCRSTPRTWTRSP